MEIDLRNEDIASYVAEQNGALYLKPDRYFTIQYQKPLVVSGCKACYVVVVESPSNLRTQALIIKTSEKPLYFGIAGTSDAAHNQAMRADFDTMIQTLKIERSRK